MSAVFAEVYAGIAQLLAAASRVAAGAGEAKPPDCEEICTFPGVTPCVDHRRTMSAPPSLVRYFCDGCNAEVRAVPGADSDAIDRQMVHEDDCEAHPPSPHPDGVSAPISADSAIFAEQTADEESGYDGPSPRPDLNESDESTQIDRRK